MDSAQETAEAPVPAARRKFWGWGLEDEGLTPSEVTELGETFARRFGLDGVRMQEPPQIAELELCPPRLTAPTSLEAAVTHDPYEVRGTPTVGRFAIWFEHSGAITPTRPTWWRFPATSASWSRSWIGAIRTAPPRFRSGVGLAWLAVWSPTLVLATEGP